MKRSAVSALCVLSFSALAFLPVVTGTAAASQSVNQPLRPVSAELDPSAGHDPELNQAEARREIRALLAAEGRSGRTLAQERSDRRDRFTDEQNVFFPSTLAINNEDDVEEVNADLPLFEGTDPAGEPQQYLITEASDFRAARDLGVNYAPNLALGRGTGGDQRVELAEDGRIEFAGTVDFSPERVIEAGTGGVVPGTEIFPPGPGTQPGAVADGEWSSVVVLPSGLVINAQIVQNATGEHDRNIAIDIPGRTVTVQLLDGWQGNDDEYLHLVTDSSDMAASALEGAVYAPRLANLLTDAPGSLLAFSPNINGQENRLTPEGELNPDRQGLNYIVSSDGEDPRNVFPLDPANDQRRNNDYSPLWNAHVSQWTQKAIDENARRAITGLEDLQDLVDEGLVESGAISPEGPGNSFIAGLRATGIIINCPVILQPLDDDDQVDNDNGGDYDD